MRFVSELADHVRAWAYDFWKDAGPPITFFGGGILINWLSDILGQQLGLATSHLIGFLPLLVLAGILVHIAGRSLKRKARQYPQHTAILEKEAKGLLTHAAAFSVIVAMNLWCHGTLAGPLSAEQISLLLLCLAPYVQAKLEKKSVHDMLVKLYDHAYDVMHTSGRHGKKPITRTELEEKLAARSKEARELDPLARQLFVSHLMMNWVNEKRREGKIVDSIQDEWGNVIAMRILQAAPHP